MPRRRYMMSFGAVAAAALILATSASAIKMPAGVHDLGETGYASASNDGKTLVEMNRGQDAYNVLDVTSGRHRRLAFPSKEANPVIAGDGRFVLATVCDASSQCSIARRSIGSGKQTTAKGYELRAAQLNSDNVSADGRFVLACRQPCENSRGNLVNGGVLDMQTHRFVSVIHGVRRGDLMLYAISADGSRLIYGGLTRPAVYAYSRITGRTTVVSHSGAEHGSGNGELSADGSTVLTVTDDDHYLVRNLVSGTSRRLPNFAGNQSTGTVGSQPMNLEGKTIAIRCRDAIFVESISTGEYRQVVTGLPDSFQTPEGYADVVLSGDSKTVFFAIRTVDPHSYDHTHIYRVATDGAKALGAGIPTACANA